MSGTPFSEREDEARNVLRALSEHERQRSAAPAPGAGDLGPVPQVDAFLASTVLKWGLVTHDQLRECLRESEAAQARDEEVLLGDLLVQRGWLSAGDLARLLREHARQIAGIPILPRFVIRDRLGEGATAVVYRAWDRMRDEFVALKVLREADALSPAAVQRFNREARTAAELDHPNVVRVHDAGMSDGRLYLVMEFVDHRSLAAVLAEGSSPPEAMTALLEKAARGVSAAHARGIVHRDLKPANILVTRQGVPKVADFGLALRAGTMAQLTRTGAVMGTPSYMAPEQVAGRNDSVSPRTDVYALGAILYQVLQGTPPHAGRNLEDLYSKVLLEVPPPPRGAPLPLQAICLKALEKDPADRYPEAGAFADDLARAAAGTPVAARLPTTLRRARRTLRRHRLAAVLACVIVGAVGTAGAAAFRHDRSSRAYDEAYREGMHLWARRLPAEALDRFRRAAELSPASPEPWLMEGQCLTAMASPIEAERAWEEALSRRPDFGPALYERGKQSLEAYLKALLLPPEQTALQRLEVGFLAADPPALLPLKRKAIRDLRAAGGLESSPRLFAQGALALLEGREVEAAAALKEYLRANPWDGTAAAVLALAHQRLGEPVEAERRLSEAIQVSEEPAWRKARGDVHLVLGNPGPAFADYAQVIHDPGARVRLEELGFARGLALWLAADQGLVLGSSEVFAWMDLSGADAHATRMGRFGRPTFTPGTADGPTAVRFDGRDDYLVLGSSFEDFTRGFSLFLNVRPRSRLPWRRILILGNGANGDNMTLSSDKKPDDLTFVVQHQNVDQGVVLAKEALESGRFQWISLIGRPVGAVLEVQVYRDGVEVGRGQTGIPLTLNRRRNYLGRRTHLVDGNFEGEIAQLMVYTRALPEAERVALESWLKESSGGR